MSDKSEPIYAVFDEKGLLWYTMPDSFVVAKITLMEEKVSMCVIVDLDLVVPAVIALEFINIRSLDGYRDNKEDYLSAMTISADQIMNYATRMKSWDLGRVVVNFDWHDAVRYLQSSSDIFEQIENYSVYSIKLPQSSGCDKAAYISDLIKSLTLKTNYSPSVLSTVGLLHEENRLAGVWN